MRAVFKHDMGETKVNCKNVMQFSVMYETLDLKHVELQEQLTLDLCTN